MKKTITKATKGKAYSSKPAYEKQEGREEKEKKTFYKKKDVRENNEDRRKKDVRDSKETRYKKEEKGKFQGNRRPQEDNKGKFQGNRRPQEENKGKFQGNRRPQEDNKGKFQGNRRGSEEEGQQETKRVRAKVDCPVYNRCGGCSLRHVTYAKQLKHKQEKVKELLGDFAKVEPIIGMENPYHYRNKVHATFGRLRNGTHISGVYEEGTHRIVPIETCLIEDKKADEIVGTIRGLLKSFKIRTYDEDTGYGLLRHVMVRTGHVTGEIMVVLVLASPILPSKNNFVKALRKEHPEITTVIINVNDKKTSMVLGEKQTTIFGKGYIEDELCGCRFRISPKSFYQVNPIQTEILYSKAIELAGLTGKERVIDAYCGIGTIGLIASKKAKEVIGVELNSDAIKDAVVNAKINDIQNVSFYNNDAGKFMVELAEQEEKIDVVFMDPPRAGSDEDFLLSIAKLGPKRVVYISCNPETMERDLDFIEEFGYVAKTIIPVDMFPWTTHVETIALLELQY